MLIKFTREEINDLLECVKARQLIMVHFGHEIWGWPYKLQTKLERILNGHNNVPRPKVSKKKNVSAVQRKARQSSELLRSESKMWN